jgi:drug/metabolite transporter (DMT)-like permease
MAAKLLASRKLRECRKKQEAAPYCCVYDEVIFMASANVQTKQSLIQTAPPVRIVLAFACVYFFWGSTFTAIRIGTAQMPALLLAGTRFLMAGSILMAFCYGRGLQLIWPRKTMLALAGIGLLLLGGGNGGLVYAEKTVDSGLASLLLAAIPLYVSLGEMLLPGGEPLPTRGWLGIALGFAGLAALVSPSLRMGIAGDTTRLLAIAAILAGALSWAAGSILSRRTRLPVNSFVAAAWQMLAAGIFNTCVGTALRQWGSFHVNAASVGSLTYLVTCGSLLGYTGYIYLLEHVPVSKVASYAYVNPVVAVLLGMLVLHERPRLAEFAGMAAILAAVVLINTAHVTKRPQPIEGLEQLPAE